MRGGGVARPSAGGRAGVSAMLPSRAQVRWDGRGGAGAAGGRRRQGGTALLRGKGPPRHIGARAAAGRRAARTPLLLLPLRVPLLLPDERPGKRVLLFTHEKKWRRVGARRPLSSPLQFRAGPLPAPTCLCSGAGRLASRPGRTAATQAVRLRSRGAESGFSSAPAASFFASRGPLLAAACETAGKAVNRSASAAACFLRPPAPASGQRRPCGRRAAAEG